MSTTTQRPAAIHHYSGLLNGSVSPKIANVSTCPPYQPIYDPCEFADCQPSFYTKHDPSAFAHSITLLHSLSLALSLSLSIFLSLGVCLPLCLYLCPSPSVPLSLSLSLSLSLLLCRPLPKPLLVNPAATTQSCETASWFTMLGIGMLHVGPKLHKTPTHLPCWGCLLVQKPKLLIYCL